MTVDKSKPFDYAQDVTRQLLTLATAVVTVTVAFVKDIATGAPADARIVLYGGWAFFTVSIICGVCTLLNLTGRVGSAGLADSDGIEAWGVRAFAIAQIMSFVVAIAAVIYFGTRSFDPSPSSCTTTTTRTTPSSGGGMIETVETADC
jgi:hypothetical protein